MWDQVDAYVRSVFKIKNAGGTKVCREGVMQTRSEICLAPTTEHCHSNPDTYVDFLCVLDSLWPWGNTMYFSTYVGQHGDTILYFFHQTLRSFSNPLVLALSGFDPLVHLPPLTSEVMVISSTSRY